MAQRIGQSILSNELLGMKLSGMEFRLAAALAVFGNRAFACSIREMADRTGMSEPTVKRALKLLEGRGLLYHAIRHKNGRRTVSRYRLMLPNPNRKHFFCLPTEAIRQLSSACLLVYAYLICRAGRNKSAYPSERQIAETLHLSRTTVRSCTAKLEAEGWIGKEKRNYEKSRKTKAYRSFSYCLDPNPQKNGISVCAVSGEKAEEKGFCFPNTFDAQSEAVRLVAGQIDFALDWTLFRPPRPPDFPP